MGTVMSMPPFPTLLFCLGRERRRWPQVQAARRTQRASLGTNAARGAEAECPRPTQGVRKRAAGDSSGSARRGRLSLAQRAMRVPQAVRRRATLATAGAFYVDEDWQLRVGIAKRHAKLEERVRTRILELADWRPNGWTTGSAL